jgi:hypothetical protein
MPKDEKKDRLTVKDAAGTALTAYIAVKVVQGVAAATRDAVAFRRARKARKTAQV